MKEICFLLGDKISNRPLNSGQESTAAAPEVMGTEKEVCWSQVQRRNYFEENHLKSSMAPFWIEVGIGVNKTTRSIMRSTHGKAGSGFLWEARGALTQAHWPSSQTGFPKPARLPSLHPLCAVQS
jgi:hypothetical protein